MYAIIETGGKQYKVSEGDEIKVEKLDAQIDSEVTFDKVIAVDDNGLKFGKDVASATVTGKVIDQARYRKVLVLRYKPKKQYNKKNGHRQPFTKIKIEKINA
jgi:large subunit ribosomal protein L21